MNSKDYDSFEDYEEDMIEDDGAKINFYTLVPITELEEELVRKNGSNAVMHMLKSKDIVDLEREYLMWEK